MKYKIIGKILCFFGYHSLSNRDLSSHVHFSVLNDTISSSSIGLFPCARCNAVFYKNS